MESFNYRGGELCCEEVKLSTLAEKFGTPLYVYSQNHILDRYRSLDRAMNAVEHQICYAMKANSNLAILRLLAREGAGFDLVSGGELFRVVEAGGDPSKCVFSGVGKTREEIAYALRLGIDCFNIESESELELISSVASKAGQRAPVALRVNPGVDPHTHHYISTGKEESKFGISIDRALAVYRRAAELPGIEIRGVQMHIGSQITSTGPYVKAIRKMRPLIEQVRAISPATLRHFDMGGGIGIRYRNQKPPSAADFARAVLPELKPVGLKVLLEPGRFIVGNAGVLVTRVVHVKKTPVKRFVIVDAAMNDLIRPALYGGHHEIVPVRPVKNAKLVTADVVGPVCETGDFLAEKRKIVATEQGALLAVCSAGAYGFTMASNYNARPLVAEVLVNGRRSEVVRRRQKLKDLIAGESVPAWLR
jgi:diaminopimelate decarboxylase